MAIPSRSKQVERVIALLEQSEEKTLAEIAETVVDGYLDLMGSAIKNPALTPHVGLAFRQPALSGVWHVAYAFEDRTVWVVSATSKFGAVLPSSSTFWEHAEQSTAKAGAPGNNNDGWQVGDRVSRRQRQFIYEVMATGDKAVLLRDTTLGGYLQESNDNLAQYYRREVEIEW